jgi:L-methionine (R)-S-oxide reductase
VAAARRTARENPSATSAASLIGALIDNELMIARPVRVTTGKALLYDELARQLEALVSGERSLLANAANLSSLLFHALPDVNWAGFYFLDGEDLVLGPFQGKTACTRIGPGRGVCGAAVARGETIVVPDVHAFSDHIACDSASRSELVVPLVAGGRVIGVLDLDSPSLAGFDDIDRAGCEGLVRVLMAASGHEGAVGRVASPGKQRFGRPGRNG